MCVWCRPFYEAFTNVPKVRLTRMVVFANMGLFPAAQMGVGEGKSIGQWYGPNTVAQVLKYVNEPSPSASWGQHEFSLAFTHSLSTYCHRK